MRAAASSQQSAQRAADALDASFDTNWSSRVLTYDPATGLPRDPRVGLGDDARVPGHWLAVHLPSPAPVRALALRPASFARREGALRFARDFTLLGAPTADAPWATLVSIDDLALPPCDGEPLVFDVARDGGRAPPPVLAKIAIVVRRNHGHATAAIGHVAVIV